MVLFLCYNSTMTRENAPTVHINIRFPAEVIAALRQYAKEDGRSLHGEVLWILRDYIRRRQQVQG
jgi:hypothetical protein